MAYTRTATSARAGSIRWPRRGLAGLLPGLILGGAALGAHAQTFTGGPFILSPDANGTNAIVRQSVSVTVQTASAIKSVSVPLGFNSSPEFEVLSQTGCVVDGTTVNAAGTVCSVNLRFYAYGPGIRTAQLRITDDAGVATNIGLSGTGFLPQAAIFPGLASIAAGSGPTNAGYTGDGASASHAKLGSPQGLATDAFGNMYIADSANHVVRMLDAFGNITTVAGTGAAGYSGDGGLATSAALNGPTWLAVDSAQNLYIADSGNHAVRKIDVSTGKVRTIAGSGTAGFGGDGATAREALLNNPQGIAVDPAGDLFIVDSGNNRIRKIDAATSVIATIAGNGGTTFNTATVAALSAHFSGATGIALDGAANVYIADTLHNQIRKLDVTANTVSAAAGTGESGKTGNGATATAATFNAPTGLAMDAAGNLYVADTGNSTVRRVESSTGVVDLFLGASKAGYTAKAAPADDTEINHATGVAFDIGLNLYVADSGNNAIRKVSAAAGSVQFPAIAVGNSSNAKSVTVSNIGNTALTFAGTPLTIANATTSTNFNLVTTGTTPCGGSIANGAHCAFTVSFAPQTTGFIPGEVDAHDNSLQPTATFVTQPVYLLGGVLTSISLTPDTLADAVPNSAYTATITGSGGFGPLALEEAGTLPAGITASVSGSVLTLSGTPTVNGFYPFTIFATDTLGNSISKDFTLHVAPPPINVNVSEHIAAADTPNVLSSITVAVIEAIRAHDTPLVLPTITVNVAEAIGAYDTPLNLPTITVNVAEAITSGDSANTLPTLVVNVTESIHSADAPTTTLPLQLTPGSGALPNPAPTLAYSTTITPSGGTAPYTLSSSGTLPSGLTISTSGSVFTISGTTTQSGNYTFTLTVRDAAGASVSGVFTFTVQKRSQTFTFNAPSSLTYGDAPFTVTASSDSGLPVTVTLFAGPAVATGSTNRITGTGTLTFRATQAGDSAFNAQTTDITIPVLQAPLTITADSFTRNYAQGNPVLTYTVTGLVYSETAAAAFTGSPALSTSAVGISAPGTYPINITSGSVVSANYAVTFVLGTLTVRSGAAKQTIQFGAIPNLPTGTNMTLTAHSSSGLAVSYTVSGPATLNGSTLHVTGTGPVTVTASQAGNFNYAAAANVIRSFTAQ